MKYKRQSSKKENNAKEAKQRTLRTNGKKSIRYKPLEARGLSEKQMLFCEEYIVDLNAQAAAIRAGYSPTSASAFASKMLNENVNIRRYVSHLKVERAKRLEISADRVVQELARIAYHDHRTFYDKHGWPISIDLITDDQQTAIRDIQWKQEKVLNEEGKPAKDEAGKELSTRYISKYSFYNRVDALRMLGHHLGMSLDKPSEKNPTPEKEIQEITFEQLLRRLDAIKLEQLTKWLFQAAQGEDKQPLSKQTEESDHWSNKVMGDMQ